MEHRFSPNYPTHTRPSDWVRRRARVPEAVAAAIVEIAFANRVRELGDRGLTLDAAFREVAR